MHPIDQSTTFNVVIGNERWLEHNMINVDEKTKAILGEEQHDGHISVLCAINGSFRLVRTIELMTVCIRCGSGCVERR